MVRNDMERKKYSGEKMNAIFAEGMKNKQYAIKHQVTFTQKEINTAFARAVKTLDREYIDKLLFYGFSASQIEAILQKTGSGFGGSLGMVLYEAERIYDIPAAMSKEKVQQVKSHLEQMFSEVTMPSPQEISDYLDFQKKLENNERIDA